MRRGNEHVSKRTRRMQMEERGREAKEKVGRLYEERQDRGLHQRPQLRLGLISKEETRKLICFPKQ